MAVVNLLEAEGPILARLKQMIPPTAGLRIGSIATFGGNVDPTKIVPAAWVQPGDGKITNTRGGGVAAVEAQQWIVHLMVGLIPDKQFDDLTFEEPGRLLAQIYTALVGWSPGVGLGALRPAGRPIPLIDRSGGWADLPIAFECDVLLRT